MNIWGRESVWFSRPPIQAVSRSFFTVKQNPKADYYKWHIPEISQSQGPRHHNVLHSMRSHTEHNLKAFEQVLFVFWRKSGRFSFFKERNTATEIGHGAALKGSTEGNQSWSYRERCRASGLGSARLPAAHTHSHDCPQDAEGTIRVLWDQGKSPGEFGAVTAGIPLLLLLCKGISVWSQRMVVLCQWLRGKFGPCSVPMLKGRVCNHSHRSLPANTGNTMWSRSRNGTALALQGAIP